MRGRSLRGSFIASESSQEFQTPFEGHNNLRRAYNYSDVEIIRNMSFEDKQKAFVSVKGILEEIAS